MAMRRFADADIPPPLAGRSPFGPEPGQLRTPVLAALSEQIYSAAASVLTDRISVSAVEVHLLLHKVADRLQALDLVEGLLSARAENGGVPAGMIVRDLTALTVGGFGFSGRIDLSCAQVTLPVQPVGRAVGLAMMLRELIGNSLRYAHPAGVYGDLEIRCQETGSGSLSVEITDDGVGLPEHMDPALEGGFGLGLAHVIARRIDATLRFESSPLGLAVRIDMPAAA